MTLVFGLLISAAGIVLLLVLLVHIGFRAPRRPEQGTPSQFGLDFCECFIPTARDRRLLAWLIPAGPAAPTLVVLHGWGGNVELMLPMAVPFHRAGMNVLLIDARNHGRSDRDSFSSLPRFAEDLGHAIDWLERRDETRDGQVVLLGHSVGAGAVLLEASRRRDIAAVISVSAFAHPEWMMRRTLQRLPIPEALVKWLLRYVQWIIGHSFEEIAPMNTVCRIPCPVLLVHGLADRTVPASDARAIRDNCRDKPIELMLIDGADHDSVEKIEEQGEGLITFLERAGVIEAKQPTDPI